MTNREATKILRGKTIERVEGLDTEAGAMSNGGTPLQAVEIHLSDGSRLAFSVQEEPDGGDYGVTMIILRPGRKVLFTDRPRGRPRAPKKPPQQEPSR
jgi:hypothetical protein